LFLAYFFQQSFKKEKMERNLEDKRVAIVVADGFEESEFTEPKKALEDAKAKVDVISLQKGKVKSWAKKDWGKEYDANKSIDEVNAGDYDALVLPGGAMNPDRLRTHDNVVKFVKHFMQNKKPVAAICHGPWTLIETGELKGRTMTSWPSLKTDLRNAGVNWVDEEVVVDNGLVTSRKPDDLKAFCKKMIEEISEGVHVR
jgi:protease I